MQNLRETGVALVTPFNEDKTIDYEGLTRLVEYNIQGGVNFLVVLGTTGEVVTLTATEKKEVVAHIKKINNGRLPVVLGIGGNNTADVIAQIKAVDTTGIEAILSVVPAYNKPTQEGMYQHFAAIAKESPLPIILYNVPSRTGSNMLPETTLKLANSFKNIIGIKEAVNDLGQALRLIAERPKGFLVFSGDDLLALPIGSAGGDGVISVIGQGIPEAFSKMIHDGMSSHNPSTYKSLFTMMPAIELVFKEGNPAGIKAMLAHKGICGSDVRLPLVKASATLENEIRHYLEQLK